MAEPKKRGRGRPKGASPKKKTSVHIPLNLEKVMRVHVRDLKKDPEFAGKPSKSWLAQRAVQEYLRRRDLWDDLQRRAKEEPDTPPDEDE